MEKLELVANVIRQEKERRGFSIGNVERRVSDSRAFRAEIINVIIMIKVLHFQP